MYYVKQLIISDFIIQFKEINKKKIGFKVQKVPKPTISVTSYLIARYSIIFLLSAKFSYTYFSSK